jgi:fatty-acyl-CoA synthase
LKRFDLKSILSRLWFVNFGTILRLWMWWIWPRRKRVFFIFEGREYSYGEVYRRSLDFARFFADEREKRVASGALSEEERLCLGIYVDNIPEFLFASFAAGLSNSILFAVNTGFRGETLASVIDRSGISMLIVNSSTLAEVERIKNEIDIREEDILLAGPEDGIEGKPYRILDKAVDAVPLAAGKYHTPRVDLFSPVLVIYTSGITGVPKGVPCTHAKMIGAGFVVEYAVRLTKRDRGYISMPLFHSNAWYIGILPQMIVGGSFVLKRKFSASAFEDDMLKYGVTFLNYVGQPLNYIIVALEKKHGSGEAAARALAHHPRNKFRAAYGNGASAVDRVKLKEYLNMDHVYEIYGSTEAVITTVNRPGDPVESLGKCLRSVVILDENDRECPPGIADDNGKLLNYDKAVGEICRNVGENNLRFGGYFGNAEATSQKFRDGVFHSGDLGHIRIINDRKYLYFNGRTDDWIRKDGENFSAENVLNFAMDIPGVGLAIAYGCPCDVSDEKVMIAVQMREGCEFDPDGTFAWLMNQQEEGGMDPRWMPDFIRVVDGFPLTNTNKIVVRPYKKEHFNLEDCTEMQVYFKEKGDTTYTLMSPDKYQAIKDRFIKNGRESLLRQG